MKNKTIRRQIMMSMFIVLVIFFVISMCFSAVEESILQKSMDGKLRDYFEKVDAVLDELEDTDPAVKALNHNELGDEILERISVSVDRIQASYFIALLAIVVISLIYSRITANKIVEPINQLEEQMKDVGEGHFDKMVHVDNAPKEIEGLTECFNAMISSLQQYLDKLTKTTSDKNKLTMELTLMRQIQANLIPSRYPTINNVMMHADAWRFSEAGVAYYDFFSIDETHLALIVGDVTDQGVMATLFAVMSQNFIRGFAKMGYAPSRILAETNNLLSEKNEFGLNVTLTVVVIDHVTGEMSYAMAGGESPILRRTGGSAEPVSDEMTIPLGNMENVVYHTRKTRLMQGDILAVFSHGVVDAKNDKEQSFGLGRLKDAIESRVGYELSEASEEIHSRITEFTGNAKQTEDGMMLLFRYLG